MRQMEKQLTAFIMLEFIFQAQSRFFPQGL